MNLLKFEFKFWYLLDIENWIDDLRSAMEQYTLVLGSTTWPEEMSKSKINTDYK